MKARILSLFVVVFVVFVCGSTLPAQEKVTVPELVARHLNSIGSAEARARASSRVASGNANFFIRVGGTANLDGTGMMVSAGPKLRFGMRFPIPEYPGEDMASDGNRASTGFLPQGGRSALGRFLNSQGAPLREGLLGGALSTAWPLLRIDQLKPQLEYRGLKKIDDNVWHELGYRARKGGGDLKVLLYFHPETWRHLRSKYTFEIGAGIGTRESSNANQESYFSLTEDFDEFRDVDGLTLPHKYRLQYSGEGRGGASLQEWTFTVSRISHGEKIEDQIFVIK